MNEINLSILILVLLLLISALLIFIIYKLRSYDSDSKLVDDLQKLVGNNQDMITKNFGDLEGTVKTKLENFYDKIFNYNNELKNSSANFIQTNINHIQEGVIFFGDERIKINYNNPEKLTIILSDKKGIYINHELQESEFFGTRKSYIKNFFDIIYSIIS